MSPVDWKYYYYISDAKVNMIFAQLAGRAFDGKTSLKVGDFEVGLELGGEASRIAKLEAVCQLIDRDGVGTVSEPRNFFRGTMHLKTVCLPPSPVEDPSLTRAEHTAYFTGVDAVTGRVIGLGGSTHHLVGAGENIGMGRPYNSGVAWLVDYLAIISDGRESDYPGSWAGEMHQVVQEDPSPFQYLEFLALRLLQDDKVFPALLGTPIYVAAAKEDHTGRECRRCGKVLPDDARFCLECGAKLPSVEPRRRILPSRLWPRRTP